ncbi:MAG: indolepyruvate oxidoreductase subunit beta [Desulfocucumaceae bacterium]
MNSLNVLLVGVGGQGTILASKVLADVALQSGLDVKMSEIHGMAQRGGSVVTHVKMGEKINSPLVEKGEADIILAFEQLEALRWLEYLKPTGEIIVSLQVIEPVPVILGKAVYPQGIVEALRSKVEKVTAVDAMAIAAKCGNPKVSNVVLVGILAQKLSFAKESWIASLKDKVPEKAQTENLKAFEEGYIL